MGADAASGRHFLGFTWAGADARLWVPPMGSTRRPGEGGEGECTGVEQQWTEPHHRAEAKLAVQVCVSYALLSRPPLGCVCMCMSVNVCVSPLSYEACLSSEREGIIEWEHWGC